MKALVLFYTSYYHTSQVARLIADTLGAELEQIAVETPYSDELISRSEKEILTGAYPHIRPLKHDLSQYDTDIIGTPTWWVSPSGPVLSLAKSGVLKGKNVYPFITTGFDVHGVEDKFAASLSGSIVHKALIVKFDNSVMETSEAEIIEYAKNIQ